MSVYLYYSLNISPVDSNLGLVKSRINLKTLKNTSLKNKEVYDYFLNKLYCPNIDVDFINIYYSEYNDEYNYNIKVLFMEILNTELITPTLLYNSESKVLLTLFDRHIKIDNNLLDDGHNSFNIQLSNFIDSLCQPKFYNLKPFEHSNLLKIKLYNYQLNNVNWLLDLENNILKENITDNKLYFFPDGRIFNYTLGIFENSVNPVEIKGGIIMDDVGIGKTLQLLCLALSTPDKQTLILVPNHLVHHWKEQITKHVIETPTYITICSFNDYNSSKSYYRIIVDEIHELYTNPKNYDLFAKLCNTNAQKKFGISATPFADSSGLYHILKFLTDTNFRYKNMYKFKYNNYIYNKIFIKNCLQNISDELKLPEISENNLLINFNNNEKIIYEAELQAKENANIDTLREICCDVALKFNTTNEISHEQLNNLVLKDFKQKYEKQIEKLDEIQEMIYSCQNKIINFSNLKHPEELKQLQHNLITFKNTESEIKINLQNRKSAYEYLEKQIKETSECPICCSPIKIKCLNQTNKNNKQIDNQNNKHIDDGITESKHEENNNSINQHMDNSINQHMDNSINQQVDEGATESEDAEDDADDDTSYDVLPCCHIYCSPCIEGWINMRKNYNLTCPMCRVNVDKTKIYRVSNIINNNYSTKINKIINIINSSNTKFIIFTQYEKLIKKLHDILEQLNISNITFNDYNDVTNFKNSNDKVLILSSTNNASGIDLSFVTNLIIMEPIIGSFNFLRDIEKQIIGRIYRNNQKNNINIYRTIISNTIEEQIYSNIL